jgi:hypothetical protein
MFIKTLDEIKEKTTPKIYQNITQKNTLSCLNRANSRQIESDYVKIVLYPIYLPIIDKLEI